MPKKFEEISIWGHAFNVLFFVGVCAFAVYFVVCEGGPPPP
jgi:hypothetical protein